MSTFCAFARIGLVALLGLSTSLFLAGCGSSKKGGAKVSGKVTYAGRPVTGGHITFTPPEGTPYQGSINADGTFAFSGVPTGDMKVSIDTEYLKSAQSGYNMPAGAPPELAAKMQAEKAKLPQDTGPTYMKIPQKYASVTSTPLTCKIEAGSQTKDFELTD